MKYELKILTAKKEYKYTLKTMSSYKWDSLLGFENTLEDLKKLDNLRQITDNMIFPNFIDEFYNEIIDKEKKYINIYKDYLLYLIYHIHFDTFKVIHEFREPSLVFIESYSFEGDYIKYDYINENFNYEYVVKQIEGKVNQE